MNRFVLYVVIFIVKILEVSISTTRIVLITKGVKKLGAAIGFFEVLIWLSLAATVLTDLSSDPFKLVVYALGFAFGNYIGSTLEEMIGIGNTRIEVVVGDHSDQLVSKTLREAGYGLTVLDGQGMEDYHSVIIMNVKRKQTRVVVEMIQSITSNVMITVNDIKPIYGGYGLRK